MNAQRLIAGLRVCTMAVHLPGRLLPKSCVVIAALMLASAACAVSVCANEYDIIIEKNLFHDQRQKWEMEKSQAQGSSSQSGSKEKQNIDQINLFGTVIKDAHSYAVMRVTQPPAQQASQRMAARRARREAGADSRAAQAGEQNQENKRPYAVGDFISGYQVIEIRPGSVLLQDPYDSKRYEIFMNASPTERTAVKTEIVEDKPATPPPAPGKDRKPPVRPQAPSAASPNPAAGADPMRQRLERDMQNMPEDTSDAVPGQVERDVENLQPMTPALDEKGQEELERLKSEFEKMQQ